MKKWLPGGCLKCFFPYHALVWRLMTWFESLFDRWEPLQMWWTDIRQIKRFHHHQHLYAPHSQESGIFMVQQSFDPWVSQSRRKKSIARPIFFSKMESWTSSFEGNVLTSRSEDFWHSGGPWCVIKFSVLLIMCFGSLLILVIQPDIRSRYIRYHCHPLSPSIEKTSLCNMIHLKKV